MQKKTKYYQASTSEIFGDTQIPQNEKTEFRPRSPYAIAKLYAYWSTVNFRELTKFLQSMEYYLIMRELEEVKNFVSRNNKGSLKFIIKKEIFYIGEFECKKRLGFCKDYVESMWLMLRAKKPSDYVIATGKSYSVKNFVEEAFKYINIKILWRGKGLKEVGYEKKTGRILVKVDPIYFRPTDVKELRGDFSKAKRELKWKPKTSFKDLVREMMDSDLNLD